MRIDQDASLRTTIRDCTEHECVAASDLSDEDWQRLLGATALQVMFPMSDGKIVFVDLGVDGLPEAASALNSAQVSE
jgi:invasion protein IalB